MGLKISLFQMNVVSESKETNIRNAEKAIYTANADLVILPEMFTTGFRTDSVDGAETMNGETVHWLKKISMNSGKAVMGSIAIRETEGDHAGKTFNRLLFTTPEGDIFHYDKRHLFSFGGENKLFTAGSERIIVDYKGFRIFPLVCYDLRFPVWSRGSNEFDLIIYVAAWDRSRIGVWNTLLRARAIENQCYVAGVNCVGGDLTANYGGHSAIVDYFGNTIISADNENEAAIGTELEIEPLVRYRDKFRVWEDSDVFELQL